LTNILVAYVQKATNFIADRVFPRVPVPKQSDVYFTYDREDWFRDEAAERGPTAESAGSGYNVDNTESYRCKVVAFHKDIPDQVRANEDSPINGDRDGTLFTSQKLMLKKERDWATAYFGASLWTTEYDGVNAAPGAGEFLQWDDASSTPRQDISAAKLAMAELTGFVPNKLVIGPEVWEQLKQHPTITDIYKHTQKGLITPQLLAEVFEVDEVLIPWAVFNSAAQGGTASYSFIYGKAALLLYAAPAPSILAPSAGYTFSWTGYLGAQEPGSRIKKFRLERNSCDRIEGEMAYDQKLVAADLGAYFATAVA